VLIPFFPRLEEDVIVRSNVTFTKEPKPDALLSEMDNQELERAQEQLRKLLRQVVQLLEFIKS